MRTARMRRTTARQRARGWVGAVNLNELFYTTNDSGTHNPSVVKASGAAASWDFGDGQTATSNTPSITYANSADKRVRIRLDNRRQVTELNWVAQAIKAVRGFSRLTGLTTIKLHGNNALAVNLVDVLAAPALTYLSFGGTLIAGNISLLAARTAMTYLYFYNTPVTGDAASLAALTNLTFIHFGNTAITYTSGAGNWTKATTIDFSNCGWDQTTVDALVGDVYAARASWVAGAKTMNVGGTNAAPGAGAAAQIAELEASYSWTITP